VLTPGVIRWYQSFEEPFVWDNPREAPVIAKYFLPGEGERVEGLFAEIRAADVLVTPEVDAKFDALANERIAAHPFRTTVLPPVSRAPRLWISPRLSSFGIASGRLSGMGGMLLFLVAAASNAVFAALAFGSGLVLVRQASVRLLLAVPLYLTAIHCFLMGGSQSRYVVPSFPHMAVLAALGAALLVARLRRAQRPTQAL
jgi:hypothetical protein